MDFQGARSQDDALDRYPRTSTGEQGPLPELTQDAYRKWVQGLSQPPTQMKVRGTKAPMASILAGMIILDDVPGPRNQDQQQVFRCQHPNDVSGGFVRFQDDFCRYQDPNELSRQHQYVNMGSFTYQDPNDVSGMFVRFQEDNSVYCYQEVHPNPPNFIAWNYGCNCNNCPLS